MTLLAPAALAGLILVPVIILFYVLRAQYQRVPIPSTLLWRDVIRDTEGRPTWRPPIRSLLLFLQLLIAILAAVALARPASLGEAATHHLLIVDASTSMLATDVEPTRFEAAKRAAADVVRGAQDGDVFTLIRMGIAADVVERSESRAQVLQAIGALQPGLTGGDVRAALQVAGSVARERSGYRNQVVVFSDGRWPGDVPAAESGLAEVRIQTIGTSADNQAVTHLRVRRLADGSNRQEGFARVHNYSDQAVEVPIRAQADGIQVSNQRLRLPARDGQELIVPLHPSVKLFEVEIDRADILPIDNYAQVVVPSEEVELMLVSPSPQFLERALTAMPSVKLTTVRPVQYRREQAGAITVFDGFVPRSRDALPAGAMLIVNPPAGSGVIEVTELRQPQQIVRVNPRSPLLDAVDLTGVFLPKALRIVAPPWASPVVESRDAGLVWEGVDEGRKVVLFGFDPRQPEIGQRLAFPLMLANAINWLSPHAGSPTLSPGQTINLQPLRDARDLVVRDPNNKSYVFPVSASARGRAIPFAQTEVVGRYAVVQRGADGPIGQTWFTVNAGEEEQSDVRPRAFPVQRAQSDILSATSTVSQELWPLLAAVALGVLCLEWVVYARR